MYWLRVGVLLFLVARAHRLEKALKLFKLEPFMKFFCMFQQKSHEPVKKPATAKMCRLDCLHETRLHKYNCTNY